jgi:hypothetical protein
MRYLICFVFIGVFLQSGWSQKAEKKLFFFKEETVEKVILDIEVKFNIKFSYIEKLAANYKINTPKKKYFLNEILESIENQTNLKFIKIDNRFYSIIQEEQETIPKINYLDRIIVEGFLANGINKTSEKYTIYPQKVVTLPGVTDADVLLSLQRLPGVKSPNETASGIHVRGGTSDQNLVLWDGIRLYHPGHLFGMISGINPAISQSVNFYNKAVNPKFGERVSSIIDIKSSDRISEKFQINAGLNALNADINAKLPLIKDKLGIQIAARKSLTEWFQSTTFRQFEDKVFQNTVFNNFDNKNKFNFQDYSAKINFKPIKSSVFSFSGIYIDNNLNYTNQLNNSVSENQEMSISNHGFSFNWNQKYSSKFSHDFLMFYSVYDFDYLKRQQFPFLEFEAYKKLNRVVDSGLEANFKYAFSPKLDLDFGYQLLGNDVSHLFNTFNQDLGVVLSFKQALNVSHIGYAFFKYKFDSWQINSGFRYTDFKHNSDFFEPRVLVQKFISDDLILQTSYEKRSQILSQIRENTINDLSLENYVWAVADGGNYPIQLSNHWSAGFIFKKNKWLVDVDLYHKTIDGLTSSLFEFDNQNVATIFKGQGFTNGMDILIQKKATSWNAWITYTYQDSNNKFDGLNNNQYFNINSNIRHAFSISYNKKWNNFSVTSGWFIHSGKPFSMINEETQEFSFNTETLATQHRMDLSGFYEFNKMNTTAIKIGFSIYNLYNNRTIISKEFERRFTNFSDVTSQRYVIQDFYSLGVTPNIFVRVVF